MSGGPGEEAVADTLEDSRVADDAAGRDIGGAGLELRLEECDDRGARGNAAGNGREDLFEGDEGEIGDDQVDGREWR